jgi:uncharacterized protein (TIGR02996 family)
MSERDALLSAILADPADDLARLVYADWLEETAEPVAMARARFIRLQIELARGVPDSHFPERAADLTQEIDALAAQWARAWLAELPPPVAKAVWKQRLGARAFRRGFVDGVTLGADTFLWAAPALFAAVPVTELHLHGSESHAKALLASPFLHRLRAVRLSGGWDGNRIARRIAKCSTLGAVRELDLTGCRLTALGADELARAAALRSLSTLRLRYNRLYESSIATLALAPNLAALTQLDVTGNPGTQLWVRGTQSRYGNRLVF